MEANENVSMKQSGNRVADAIVEWVKKEGEDRKIFGDDIVNKRQYAKEKLKYFEAIRTKYAGTNIPEEKRYLKILKGEMPDLKKAGMPSKRERTFYVVKKVVLKGARLFVEAAKIVGEGIAVHQERKRDEAIKKSLAKNKDQLKTVERYDKAVRPILNKDNERPVLNNNNQQIAGPDRHMRGNNVETERGKDEKVRHDFDDGLPLLPKKNNPKGQSVSASDDALLPKNREGTGKGMSV